MPKQTFYNLPEEKKTKILDAARIEFFRVPFQDVSINQIIKHAEIPRGSFYQYFEDKEDLFDYFLHSYSDKVIFWFLDVLKECKGNLFDTMGKCFESYLNVYGEYLATGIMNLFCNPWIREKIWGDMECKKCKNYESVKVAILEIVDTDHLNVHDDDEVIMLLELMGMVVQDSISHSLIHKSNRISDEDIKQYYSRIEFFRKGFQKE